MPSNAGIARSINIRSGLNSLAPIDRLSPVRRLDHPIAMHLDDSSAMEAGRYRLPLELEDTPKAYVVLSKSRDRF